ncbi:MAG TPA: hypothetical protein PKM63_13695 [Panacibacter sp.]|nr:hypothetical protein [Panacibacter sp.]HNP45337.1 hypothetical protein [Panacibacter sp.]
MWHFITQNKANMLKKGSLLAPKIPGKKYSLVFIVNGIDEYGYLDLISRPMHFNEQLHNLISTATVKPETLVTEGWYYYNAELDYHNHSALRLL